MVDGFRMSKTGGEVLPSVAVREGSNRRDGISRALYCEGSPRNRRTQYPKTQLELVRHGVCISWGCLKGLFGQKFFIIYAKI